MPPDPVIDSREEELMATLGPLRRSSLWVLLALLAIVGWGVYAYVYQLIHGLAATAMTDYFSWGIYIVNFVFFIGISMAGSVISAVLRLTGAEWRRPITRMAEGITVLALMMGGVMLLVDMGRPDRFLYLVRYGRAPSPILWDLLCLLTYLGGSILYLYLPMIPDLAILRDNGHRFARWRQRLYTVLAMGWRGAPAQKRRLHRATLAMTILIIPVAVSIHTVTAWLFGLTLRTGWHSTIIGPDFVVGALYSGIAAVITAMAVFTKVLRLERFLTADHFRKMGLLLLAAGVTYLYFVVNEYIGAAYLVRTHERKLLEALFMGPYMIPFWSMAMVGLVLPIVMLALPWTRTRSGIVIASILVNLGMWLKRYIVVVPTLSSPFLPRPPMDSGGALVYFPTWVEWSISAAAFAAFVLLYILFSKVFPVVSLWEREEGETLRPPARAAAVRAAPLPASAAVWMLILALAGGPGLAAPSFAGAAASADSPAGEEGVAVSPPHIVLETTVEEGQTLLLATVTRDKRPVESARVSFLVKRTFGLLKLGEDTTLNDGTAAVPFPLDLPADKQGRLHIVAAIMSGPATTVARAEADFSGGHIAVSSTPEPVPRALWAQHAPIPLVVGLFVIVGGVWGTYGFVIYQLACIRKER